MQTSDGQLWLAGWGLNLYNSKTDRFTQFFHNSNDQSSLSHNKIRTFCEDRSGNLWVGTDGGGLNKTIGYRKGFHTYRYETDENNNLRQLIVLSITEDQYGEIWFGTQQNGIFRLNRKSEEFTRYPHPKASNVTSLFHDGRGTLWVGTFADGVWKLDSETSTFSQFLVNDRNPFTSEKHPSYVISITSIVADKFGSIWFGCPMGIMKYTTSTGDFQHYGHTNDDSLSMSPGSVYSIYIDSQNRVWVGTAIGLNRFDQATEQFVRFFHEPEDPASFSQNQFNSIYQDDTGTIWVGTYGGFAKLNEINNSFKFYTKKNGLPSNRIWGLVGGNNGNIWISSEKGISKYNIQTGQFRNFDTDDGISSNEFNQGAYYRLATGEITFGSAKGLTIFHPDSIKINMTIPPIIISEFRVNNKPFPLDTNVTIKKFINLDYNQNFLSFEFTALDFHSSKKNQYAYMLHGIDKEWIYSGNHRFASYTDLSPGEYTFRVKGSNNDGVWNENGVSMKIHIAPPIWKTWWAYILYGFCALIALLAIRKYDLNRIHLKNQLKIKQVEAETLKELDHLKSEFFANISHEFRTPLTLIIGIINKFSRVATSKKDQSEYKIIRHNAAKLLNLINTLLDLSKLETRNYKLQVSRNDIVKFLRRIVASFASFAAMKGVNLTFNGTELASNGGNVSIYTYFDQDKMEKVFNNLLSNAIKFTPEFGKIDLTIVSDNTDLLKEPHFIKIIVTNTGKGIPTLHLPHIFDRFYQVESDNRRSFEGTGIGLAIVKEFVELHHGEVSVSSTENEKTIFTVILPLDHEQFQGEEIIENNDKIITIDDEIKGQLLEASIVDSVGLPTGSDLSDPLSKGKLDSDDKMLIDKPLVLVVEDHEDLRKYICEVLEDEFKIIEANNGLIAYEKAQVEIPDLIISDIMMPKMDGQELCKKLKSNFKTNHVPIILLTAKATSRIKMESLKQGADDYVVKPFQPEELKVRAYNLIKIRQQLREKFSTEMSIQPMKVIVSSLHREFLEQLIEKIEERIDDTALKVESLAKDMGISRSQLQRRLSALVKKSPSEFIRHYRLERAATLILQDADNIAQIAFQVGFKSQQHFTRCFKEQFKCTPKAYKKKYESR